MPIAPPQTAAHPAGAEALSPWTVYRLAWQNRRLIGRLTRRELASRYRGSFLGFAWMFITPVLILAVYTFVFSVVFRARWNVPVGGKGEFALLLFAGLNLYNVFSETANRTATLLIANVNYIKKVVFPLEVLPIVTLVTAMFTNLVVNGVILLAAYFLILGVPPWTAVLFPVVVLPLALFTLGVGWFLSSMGVYIRDLGHAVGVVTLIMVFLSPIFYPVEAVPAGFRTLIYLSPFTLIIEQGRDLLFWGRLPNFWHTLLATGGAFLVNWLGYIWFAKTRKGFADVV
ncbi:MAG: ABC transporter permease [Deltaproteobacteria bacterium]|nr:ABC transporter permease [Deltaproteobacteria bacterium]